MTTTETAPDVRPPLSVLTPRQLETEVEYRDISGSPGYRVGSNGSVWSCRGSERLKGKITGEWRRLKISRTPTGYCIVSVNVRGRRCSRTVHRMVLEAFVGPCPAGMEACHFPDPDRTNNDICNLRWDTRRNNAKDKYVHGTQVFGEQVLGAKLTEADIPVIRSMLAAGVSKSHIAAKYGVQRGTIGFIARGQTWRHII